MRLKCPSNNVISFPKHAWRTKSFINKSLRNLLLTPNAVAGLSITASVPAKYSSPDSL